MHRNRPGDRMIVMVGLLVAVAVAVLIGFSVLVAQRVDQDSAQRELELARGGGVALKTKLQQELATFAHWDEAVERTANAADRDWIHRHFGAHLHESSGHDHSFILNSDGDAIYASINGYLMADSVYSRMRWKIEPLVEAVHLAFARDVASHVISGEVVGHEPPPEPKSAAEFRRIEGRPALIGVTTIVPRNSYAARRNPRPAVAVSIAFLDEDMLQSFARELAISEVSLYEDPAAVAAPAYGQVAYEVPLSAGEMPAWLVWTPTKPGAAMLARLMPGLIGVAGILALTTLMVLFYVRRTTERLSQSERRATELAYRDVLTGLANRVQLLETLAERLESADRSNRLALILIDLDGFKDINDTLGHPVGDEMLFAIGERLTTVAGEEGMAVRFGGDEFALLVPVGEGTGEVSAICRRVTDSMRAPIYASEQHLTISATVGVAVAPEDAHEAEQLLRRADIALYRAKAEGRGGHRLFDPSFEEVLHKRSSIERDLTRALDADELAVMFQPQYASDGQRMVGVEALVRWNHPERGLVPPSEFIPVAEQSTLVMRLDEGVLRQACQEAARWPGLALAVNLSAVNFRHPNMAERVTRVLTETGFDPRRLEIEITESVLLGATGEVLGELSELRRHGIRIALDDFGTGYSSLGYLRRFPVDKIKIDKSFVQNLGITEDAAAIVECVARLGRALGLAVTAEGVETGEQHRFVRAAGCHQVQGYLFAAPVDADRVSELVQPAAVRGRAAQARLATA